MSCKGGFHSPYEHSPVKVTHGVFHVHRSQQPTCCWGLGDYQFVLQPLKQCCPTGEGKVQQEEQLILHAASCIQAVGEDHHVGAWPPTVRNHVVVRLYFRCRNKERRLDMGLGHAFICSLPSGLKGFLVLEASSRHWGTGTVDFGFILLPWRILIGSRSQSISQLTHSYLRPSEKH